MKKRKISEQEKQRLRTLTLGIKQTEEHKIKRGIYKQKSETHRMKISLSNIGKKLSIETRDKISHNHADVSKEKNPRWLGGRESYYRRQGINVWEEYWREEVPKGYLIHHVDRDIENNNICNLALVTTHYHAILHDRGKWERFTDILKGGLY